MKYYLYIAISLISTSIFSQSIDEEIGFMYTKAKYLVSTDRSEDAIKVLNNIVAKNQNYEDALLMRAEAKYILGAYAGVRKDLNSYMSNNGITARVARLYGLSDYQGGKDKAALNSLSLAILEIKDDKLIYEARASLLEKKGKLLQACKDYRAAAKLGSSKASTRADRLCGKEKTKQPKTNKKKETKRTNRTDRSKKNTKRENKTNTSKSEVESTDVQKENTEETEVIVTQEEVEVQTEQEEETEVEVEVEEEEEDTSVNEIKVDDDLTLLISGEGLGSREVMNQPNILIISDQSGTVSVDICVSRGGRVTSATFDNINSTIKKQSLVSLAVRKAKEFWFDAGIGNDKCGKLVFKIGSGS